MRIVLVTITQKFIDRLAFIEEATNEQTAELIHSILAHDGGLREHDTAIITNCDLYVHKVLCMDFDLLTYDGEKAFHFQQIPHTLFEQYFTNSTSTQIDI